LKLTAKLAKSQLEINRSRTVWTLVGIILSVAMLTAVYGFAIGGRDLVMTMTIEGMVITEMESTEEGIQVTAEFMERHLYQSARFTRIFVSIAAVLSVIIVGISVVVVSNAFRISATERLRQFGILKSVGATRRQIRQTVIYESIFLALLGIPIGLIVGFAVQGIGIQIANYFLNSIVAWHTETLQFTISPAIIIAAIIVSFVMAILAAWLPARKAAKVPAIDAIRGAGEVVVKAKQLHRGKLIGKIFGYEGTLAAKSQKRNRRSVRATVIALTISVVLFISAAGFGHTIGRATDIAMGLSTNHVIFARFFANWNDRETNLANQQADEITARIRGFGDVSAIGIGSDRSFFSNAYIHRDMMTPAMIDFLYNIWFAEEDASYYTLGPLIITTDPETYTELARKAGVPYGSNILINHMTMMFTHFDEDGPAGTRWIDFVPFVFSPTTIELTDRDGSEHQLEIHGTLARDQLPNEVWDAANGGGSISILVPEWNTEQYAWFATPANDDLDEFESYVYTVLQEVIDPPEREIGSSEPSVHVWVTNWQREADMQVNTARLVMVFIYGFVALLIVIGLTNIISTVSTNIYARSREFATLKSIGMDARGLRRILNFESIFCSAKALIIGLPIGLLASWVIHLTIVDTVMFTYEVPWMAVVQCVLGVFVITWAVTRFSARKLRGQNIVETIRMESGM